jgi:hypothetical protein
MEKEDEDILDSVKEDWNNGIMGVLPGLSIGGVSNVPNLLGH